MKNVQCLSTDVQVCIEPPPIHFIKAEMEEINATHIIKVEFWRKPSQATLETYKINISTFDNGQPEEFLALLRNFKIEIYGTVMDTAAVRINYQRTMLHGTSLREFNGLALAGNSTANHLNHTTEGLIDYPPPLMHYPSRSVL